MNRPVARRIFALLISVSLLGAMGAAPAAAVDGGAYVAHANARRASVGLPPVGLHASVDQVAVERANQLAATDVFVHDMTYVVNRLRALGVCFTGYGEIIAWESGYPTYDPARTILQWWNSPGHKAIMLGDYNAAGGSHTTSNSTGRIYSVMVFVKLCAGSTVPAPPPASDANIERLQGADRYATAAAISRKQYPSGASTVFIATGGSFPDALAGAPAAARAKGPILLTASQAIPAATHAELLNLKPSKIVVLGGPGAVSDAVFSQLHGYAGSVERWWGATRFDTAADIARKGFARGVEYLYVATGRSFPDALSGGAVAGRVGGPILLVERDSVPGSTLAAIRDLSPRYIIVLGGAGVVSEGVRHALQSEARSGQLPARLAGADRYATSVQISQSIYGSSAGSDTVFVATGSNFPDGLAGGPVAALVPGPLLLVAPNALPSSVAAELKRLHPDEVFVLGGGGAVSDAVLNAIHSVLP